MYEELKSLKELLDAGVLTQEEFDAKKRQLLGLNDSAQGGEEGEAPAAEEQAAEPIAPAAETPEDAAEEPSPDGGAPQGDEPSTPASDGSEADRPCPPTGYRPADEAKAPEEQAESKAKEQKKKKKLPIIIAVVAVALVALLGLAMCLPSGNIDNSLITVKRMYRAYTGEALLSHYSDIEKQKDGNLRTDSTFSEIEGYYDIYIYDEDDRVDRLVFRWDDGQEFDAKKVVRDINGSLGKYKEYDAELNHYEWESDWLIVDFYPEEGIWLDKRGDVVPADSPCEEHDWREALCWQPKTCLDCGATEGEALGHEKDSKLTLDYVDTEEAKAHYFVKCTRCGARVDSETRDVDSLAYDGKFLLSISDFTKRLDSVLDENGTWLSLSANAILGTLSKYPACAVATKSSNRQIAGIVYFKDGETAQTDKYSTDNRKMMVQKTSSGTSKEFASATAAVIMALNPGLSTSECLDIATKTAKRALSGDTYSYNGIKYGLTKDGSTLLMAAS